MSRIGEGGGRRGSAQLDAEQRRLAAAADREGNADGVATEQELATLAEELEQRPTAEFDRHADERIERAKRLASDPDAGAIPTLAPELRALPPDLRRLALEIDALWGNADGELDAAEIDRVARYCLAALPFFTERAARLLELAGMLGLDAGDAQRVAPSVLALRCEVANLDADSVAAARPFAELFGEAVASCDIPGAPGLLRDALQHSPRWHKLSILEHTAVAVDAVHALADRVNVDWREAGATMLLHDIGKVLTRHIHRSRRSERFVYWDHHRVGADWLAQRQVPEEVVFQIRHHLDLHKKTARQVIKEADRDPARVQRMLLVFMADHVAKGDTADQLASTDEKHDKILELADFAGIDGAALLDEADRLRARWFGAGAGDRD